MSYYQILYHIVFRTKSNSKAIEIQHKNDLFMYIHGYIKNKNCTLYRINAMEDHVHLLTSLHPAIALADFVRDLKITSSIWLKQNKKFPPFPGWGEGYAALTYSYQDKDIIVNYIRNQEEHHKKNSFQEELIALMKEQGVELDPRFFL